AFAGRASRGASACCWHSGGEGPRSCGGPRSRTARSATAVALRQLVLRFRFQSSAATSLPRGPRHAAWAAAKEPTEAAAAVQDLKDQIGSRFAGPEPSLFGGKSRFFDLGQPAGPRDRRDGR